MFTLENVPVDLLRPILDFLSDRRHLSAAALVSWAFNRAATPLLYRTLDSQLWHNVRFLFLYLAVCIKTVFIDSRSFNIPMQLFSNDRNWRNMSRM